MNHRRPSSPGLQGHNRRNKSAGNGQSLFAQIAAKAGVTPAAITLAMQDSKSISMKMKERVFWTSRRLGYRRSRVREKHHLNIAAVLGAIHPHETLQSSANTEIWEGLSHCAEENEMALHTYVLHSGGTKLKFEDIPVLLRRDQLDGVVILGAVFPSLLDFLRKARVPTVVGSNYDLPAPVDQVRIDMVEGARALALRLLDHGHKYIGFLTGGAGLLVHQQMYRGFEDVMRKHRTFSRVLVQLVKEPTLHGIHPADVLLKQKPRPTAIFTTHWQAGCQVAFAAIRVGIGFDSGFEIATGGMGESLDFVYPVLRLNTHPREVGRKAFERLMELHREPRQKPKTLTIQCSVEAFQSSYLNPK
ncbi:MAG: LacI family DNA-binding transcriptional regulator [Verrucomicrobia bacterium]|nr:LacI family DNA-binding transcriptional regulator [Verrucomicrobiota bacterium]